VKGAPPAGTLECPEGYVLDEALDMCVPENPTTQASSSGDNFVRPQDMPAHLRPKKPKKKASAESAAPFKPTDKMERCIKNVKAQLRKTRKGMDSKVVKSTAIAICRSRLKQ
jgi:hypothetical protein